MTLYLVAIALFVVSIFGFVTGRKSVAIASLFGFVLALMSAAGVDIYHQINRRPAWLNWLTLVSLVGLASGYFAYEKWGKRIPLGLAAIFSGVVGTVIAFNVRWGLWNTICAVAFDLYVVFMGLRLLVPAKAKTDEKPPTPPPSAQTPPTTAPPSDAAKK